jgi:hypothetical protein
MGYTPVKLFLAVLTASDVAYYTVPADSAIIVKEIVLTNTTATNATASISFVPYGGAAGLSNRIFEQAPIPAFTTVVFGLSTVMPVGEFVAAKASAATTLTMRVSAVAVT